MVEDRTASALIDLGSEATLVRKSWVRDMKIKQCRKVFKGVSGKTIDVIGECLLQVQVSPSIQTSHIMVVVPDHLLDTDFLFGADMLGKYDVGWSATRQTFTWAGYMYKTMQGPIPRVLRVAGSIRRIKLMNSEVIEEKKISHNVHLNENISLRKRNVQIMKFKVNIKDPVLAVKLKIGSKDLSLVVKQTDDGSIYLPIFNFKNGTLRLKAGHMIASYEAIGQLNHIDLEGETICSETELNKKFEEFIRNRSNGSSFCTVCDSHFDLLTAVRENLNEHCRLVNSGEDKDLCTICHGLKGESSQIRNLMGIENTMIPDNLKGTDEDPSTSRVERLKLLIKKQDLSHLDRDQRKQLKRKILAHEELFVLGPSELGRIKIPPVKIHLEDDKPVRSPSFRHPEKAKEIILNLVDDMKEKDVIEPSNSAWLSPIVLVSKPNSSTKRFCIDFRRVNTQLRVDLGVLPKLDELVEAAAGHRYYITVDLKEAYYQVVLDEESRDITTFSDGCNLYRFKRLPYGLSSSSAVFSRALAIVLAPLAREKWIKSYLDDIILWAEDFDTLIVRMEKVFERFETMGLKLNLEKCSFAQKSVKFLGNIVSVEGVSPCPDSIEAIRSMKPPTDVKGVRRFLGCTGFFRKFVSDYAKHALPLTNLTRKGIVFRWTSECQVAFEHLKVALITAPVLAKASMDKKFFVHVDSSDFATGGALLQEDETGLLRPVGFFSRKFNNAERRYSATDKEALGVVLICRYFHHYLWGNRFVIKTDHQPLTSVFKQKTKSPRMNRWILEMRDYSFIIEYKKGATHYVADHLSRPVGRIKVNKCRVAAVSQNLSIPSLVGVTMPELREHQKSERRWLEVIEYLEGGSIPKYGSFRSNLANFELFEGVLYYIRVKLDGSIHYCLVVPTSLKKAALEVAHADHFGQKKTIVKLEEFFYWPKYRGDVVKYVTGCKQCQEYKEGRHLRRRWQELPTVSKPLDRISVDLTDLVNGYNGYRYVFTIVCHFSRFVVFYPLRNKTTETVTKHMKKYFLTYGRPEQLISDRGLEFKSFEFQKLCEDFGVSANPTLPFHPQGNSISERMHRTFKTTIAIMSERNPLAWPQYLDDAAYALNTMVHATTGAQPYFAFFSRHAKRNAGVPLPVIEDDEEGEGLSEAQRIIRETSKRLSRKTIDIANRNRIDERVGVGDLVWLLNEYQIPGTARKLNKKWLGPYKVESVIRGGAAYKLRNPFNPEQDLLSRAADKVKVFHPEAEFLIAQEEALVEEEVNVENEDLEEEGPTATIVQEPSPRYPKRIRKPKVPYSP